jgi:hypothetical protein
MDWKLAAPAMIGAIVVALGWFVGHYFNVSREIASEKRKTSVAFLLEAYRRLQNAANREGSMNAKHAEDIESAIADIQLLGTPNQVALAVKFSELIAKTGGGDLDSLLYDFRKTLRQELDLKPVTEKLIHLRFSKDNTPNKRPR